MEKADRGADVRWVMASLPEDVSGQVLITLPAGVLKEWVLDLEQGGQGDDIRVSEGPGSAPSWRERIWTVPRETRMGVGEVAEALGRSRSWVYQRIQCPQVPLPARKFCGGLVFIVGEVREWIRAAEEEKRSVQGASVLGEAA